VKNNISEVTTLFIWVMQEIKQKRLDRSRTSAKDDRPSAQGVGIAAIIILVAICGSIVILDISTIAVQCKQFSNQGRRRSSRYKHRHVYVHNNNNANTCVTTYPSGRESPPFIYVLNSLSRLGSPCLEDVPQYFCVYFVLLYR
jgi:hypothetical protein